MSTHAPFDLLVVANPVWEASRLVAAIPEDGSEPISSSSSSSSASSAASSSAPSSSSSSFAEVLDGGGSALNTACALALAGRRVLAVGRVGDDAPGHAAVEALQRRGVATRVEIVPGRTTKTNELFVTHDADTVFRAFVPHRAVPPWTETPPGLLEGSMLLLDRLAATAPQWLSARRSAGLWNGLNRNSARGGPSAAMAFERALPHLDFLQLPEGAPGEAWTDRGLLHRPSPFAPVADEEIGRWFAAGVAIVVRTRGAGGVCIHWRAAPSAASGELAKFALPAVPTEVVDPTGAGDAFTAGFLDALLENRAPVVAATQGLDWAARACRHLGARGWLDCEPPHAQR